MQSVFDSATGVVFDVDPATRVVHRATPVSDEFGAIP